MTSESHNKEVDPKSTAARQFLRFTALSTLVFLAVTLAAQIPKVNSSVELSSQQSHEATATVFAAQLERYILDRELALSDIAGNEYVAHALLMNNQSSPPFLDFIDHALLLGEDVDLTVLNVSGELLYSERSAVREYSWAEALLESDAEEILRLDSNSAAPRFELALPIYYGRGREGVLIASFNAVPELIFDELESMTENSGIAFRVGNATILSKLDDIEEQTETSFLLDHYPIELTYFTNAKLVAEEKRSQIVGFLTSSLGGAVIAFLLLFIVGRKIILAPYQQLADSQAAISQSVEGIARVDSGGKYVSANEAYATIFGYTVEELVGKHWKITVCEEEASVLSVAHRTMLKTGSVTIETRGTRKDGSIVHIESTMVGQHEDERFVGLHCFMTDISRRKVAEAEREKLITKLNDSNEELERFAYICSHDMQEPVRMIRSFGEKLKNHMEDKIGDDEKAQRYLHFVTDGAVRAQNLIEDILAYSRLQQDTVSLEEVGLNEIVDQVRETMRDNLEEIGGEVTNDNLPIVTGHKTQLYQLFQNLINNGLKYQPKGTKPRVHVGTRDTGTHWEFSIKDNGIGIEPRHQKKIFDIFQRLHRKDEYAGTGVGLSICKKIAERHGGRIRVESQKGKGATFIFTVTKSNYQETPNELAYQTG